MILIKKEGLGGVDAEIRQIDLDQIVLQQGGKGAAVQQAVVDQARGKQTVDQHKGPIPHAAVAVSRVVIHDKIVSLFDQGLAVLHRMLGAALGHVGQLQKIVIVQ